MYQYVNEPVPPRETIMYEAEVTIRNKLISIHTDHALLLLEIAKQTIAKKQEAATEEEKISLWNLFKEISEEVDGIRQQIESYALSGEALLKVRTPPH